MTVTCCSRILPAIEIDTPTGSLAMGYCPNCDRRQWYLGAAEVEIREVLELAASEDWRNTRNWKKPSHLRAVA